MSAIQWNPTPDRDRTDDEFADVEGFGRFQVSWHLNDKAFRVRQNGEVIGSLHSSAEKAKTAVEGIVASA